LPEDKLKLGVFFGRSKDLPSPKVVERLIAEEADPEFKSIMLKGLAYSIALDSKTKPVSLVYKNDAMPPDAVLEINNALIGRISYGDTPKAVRMLDENWDGYSQNIRANVMSNAGLSAPEKVKDSVLPYAQKYGYNQVARPFIGAWLKSDPLAASKWISDIPDVQMRDRGVAQMVGYLRKKGDTQAAEEWTRQIQDRSVLSN